LPVDAAFIERTIFMARVRALSWLAAALGERHKCVAAYLAQQRKEPSHT
jgi:hypothetical protein